MAVPAFGEEMNKTRRMLTELSIQLSHRGVAMLVPDLSGTGDSEGNFADADWDQWIDDLNVVADWAAAQGLQVDRLVTVRTGALLAAQYVQRRPVRKAVLWQPVFEGSTFVKQTLRVRTLAGAMSSAAKERVEDLIGRIAGGEALNVAGYPLTANTVGKLMKLKADDLALAGFGSVHTIDVTASTDRCGTFEEKRGGTKVEAIRLLGVPYWNPVETIVDHSVIARTVDLLAA
jgi:exosortase A-associated hydrolase 2